MLLWKSTIDISILAANDFFVNCLILNDPQVQAVPWQFTFVYGPPVPSLKPSFWDDMNKLGDSFLGSWIAAGDFNSVLNQSEKIGGKPVASSSRDGFRNMVDRNGFVDLGYNGYSFTWNNKRPGRANIQERLDRGFANGQWRIIFPSTSISHLSAFNSNHKPLLIDTFPPNPSKPKPFRFKAMWIKDPSAGIIIQNAWSKGDGAQKLSQCMSKIKTTKLALKDWNFKVF